MKARLGKARGHHGNAERAIMEGGCKMAMPQTAKHQRLAFEQFLEALDEDTRAEWVDGEVVWLSPAGDVHESLCGFLYAVLRTFAEQHQLGRVLVAPFVLRLTRSERAREPDILFVKRETLARLKATYVEGPADLVVEITSPESLLRDRGEKYAEYELEGVTEYWVIQPEAKRADFFVLNEGGWYERQREAREGIYLSTVMEGLALPIEWLWQPPPLAEALKKLNLV
jgi:Uma2 family endonuclease